METHVSDPRVLQIIIQDDAYYKALGVQKKRPPPKRGFLASLLIITADWLLSVLVL